jgi:hypothetical protein
MRRGRVKGGRRIENPPQIANLPHKKLDAAHE